MNFQKLNAEYFSSLPIEYKIKGEEIFKNRKRDFKITGEDEGNSLLLLPFSLNSNKPIKVSITHTPNSVSGNCTCKDFNRFDACSHVAAATLFMAKNKEFTLVNHNRAHTGIELKSGTGYELAFLFHTGLNDSIGLRFKTALLLNKKNVKSIERFSALPHLRNHLLDRFDPEARDLIEQLEGGRKEFMNQWLMRDPFAENYSAEQTNESYLKYIWIRLIRLWPVLKDWQNLYSLSVPDSFKIQNIKPATLIKGALNPEFYIYRDRQNVVVQLLFSIGNKSYRAQDVSAGNKLLLNMDGRFFLPDDFEHVKLMTDYKDGVKSFPFTSKLNIWKDVISPLQNKFKTEVHPDLQLTIKEVEPQPFVLVAEYLNNYLMLMPYFNYEDKMVAYNDQQQITGTENGQDYYVNRAQDQEKRFYESLRPLHPTFSKQLQREFFYVPFQDVMKNNWLLKTIRKLQDENVLLKGLDSLKKFKHSTKTPKFTLKVSSGIDWFDLKIKFSYEDTLVPLKDIQTAILSGQKMVVLGDGSFGVLPEEWLGQFEAILRMGKIEGDTLKLDKKLFYLLQDVEISIKEEKVLKELEEKKRSLIDFEEKEMVPLSQKIKAKLRPYQLAGFHWLQSLDNLGWGGCLADDMGLGKTLQTISFLQFVKEKYQGSCNLIVCPTSLIYNWESEVKKFAPDLRYIIYYGYGRKFDPEFLNQFDLIITSYGSVRNDIDELKKHLFHYIVLDESQTIKNPEARTTRVFQLLNSRNRIILSGTPIQNNTFDLYAQMNFLNPGLLGNKNSFKNHFAIPIDKEQNREAAAQLRKITRPFILRRTKEKVAPDLPDKMETILWCHMKDKQREFYERYKENYRIRLMNKIDENGIKKSSFEILEGLTRLRQICDSPQLVHDLYDSTTESAKIRELLRELEENSGHHKVLIFSQFTSMLALIREEFERVNISHVYLDGKTPGKTRLELVKNFQEDESIKAFLISLKAGGVGLNLTAADYVYLVDPWWNPAAESQAIDRTHRIGQTKKVFAYKMICKDSIEEKILHLQEKKKSLSEDLIGEEASFVSKLTKEDIEYLFS